MDQKDYSALIMERSSSICYISDIYNYEILYLSKAGMDACGLSTPEEYQGKKCYQVLQGLDSPCPFCTNDYLLEEEDYCWEHYNEILGAWYDLTDRLIYVEGRLCRMEIARDITDRKTQLAYLSDRLSLESVLMESLGILTSEKDMESAMQAFLATIGGYYSANRAYIFEFDIKNQKLFNTFEWCAPDVSAEIDNLQNLPLEVVSDWIRKFEACGEFYITSLNSDVDTDSDTYRILEAQGIQSLMTAPLIKNGKIVGFIGVDDPTDNLGNLVLLRATSEFVMEELEKRRLMTELEEALDKANIANRSKTNFLFNMSHDIRTPMNAILGFATMTRKYIDDKERALDSLEKLNNAGKHLQRLINDVLDMARIESGKVNFNLQPHYLPGLLAETQALFDAEMQKKDIIFSVSWELEDEIVFLDRLRMEQIELNLIGNALKYTPAGGKVSYTFSQIGSADGYATYRAVVKDNGIGMSKEFSAHVFEAFTRENTSTVDGIQGTGLGLAITKTLIEQMNGTIHCESEPGAGTEFIFIVSFKIGDKSDLPEEMRESAMSTADFTGKRILLVEDNELNREIAADILIEYGFAIEEAEDGAIAVEKYSNSAPGYYDLILMDIQMPNMDGYQATRAIRKLSDKSLANIPIIAMTANAFEEDRQNALEAGMDAHVAKPIDIQKLMATLRQNL